MSNISQDLCVRLQELRQRCYGSRGRSAFARDLAIPVSTYILYEQSRMPPADVLVRAAHVTGANLQWLMTGQGLQKIPNQMVVHPITARFDAILSARPELEKQAVELLRMLESLAQDIPARQKESQEYLSKHVALTSGISQGHPKNLLPSATLLPVVGSTSAGPAGYWADLPELAAGDAGNAVVPGQDVVQEGVFGVQKRADGNVFAQH